MIKEDWDREAASYPQLYTSEPWLDDTSPNTDPQADLQKERGAHGFQNEAGNTFRTNNENSIHVRQKILDSGPQSDKCSPPISSTNRIFFIQQDQA